MMSIFNLHTVNDSKIYGFETTEKLYSTRQNVKIVVIKYGTTKFRVIFSGTLIK
jgi:hypothetical protein